MSWLKQVIILVGFPGTVWGSPSNHSMGPTAAVPTLAPTPRKMLTAMTHMQQCPTFPIIKGFTKKELWPFSFKCQKEMFLSFCKNTSFLLVLLKVTQKTKGGEAGKEGGKEKAWRQGLENESLCVENVFTVSPRQDLKQRNHAEKHMENSSKIFLSS